MRPMRDRETRLATLDASIARGLADAQAGRTAPAEAVFDRLEAKYRARGGSARTPLSPTSPARGEGDQSP